MCCAPMVSSAVCTSTSICCVAPAAAAAPSRAALVSAAPPAVAARAERGLGVGVARRDDDEPVHERLVGAHVMVRARLGRRPRDHAVVGALVAHAPREVVVGPGRVRRLDEERPARRAHAEAQRVADARLDVGVRVVDRARAVGADEPVVRLVGARSPRTRTPSRRRRRPRRRRPPRRRSRRPRRPRRRAPTRRPCRTRPRRRRRRRGGRATRGAEPRSAGRRASRARAARRPARAAPGAARA